LKYSSQQLQYHNPCHLSDPSYSPLPVPFPLFTMRRPVKKKKKVTLLLSQLLFSLLPEWHTNIKPLFLTSLLPHNFSCVHISYLQWKLNDGNLNDTGPYNVVSWQLRNSRSKIALIILLIKELSDFHFWRFQMM
jgi:hypothetical protein